jgi:PAS domain S-box-containing protein
MDQQNVSPDALSTAICEKIADLAPSAAVVIGTTALIGWTFNISILHSRIAGYPAIKPMTAVCMMLLGIALSLRRELRVSRDRELAGGILSLLAAANGANLLADYLFHRNLPIERWLLGIRLAGERTSPQGAAVVLLLGAAVFWLNDRRKTVLSQGAAILALVVCVVGLNGYLYGIGDFYGINAKIGMSWPAMAAEVALALGVLCARPNNGLMRLVNRSDSAGLMCRIFIPTLAVVPFAVDWLRLLSEGRGFLNHSTLEALDTLANQLIFGGTFLYLARLLGKADDAMHQAIDKTTELAGTLQTVLDSASQVSIISSDPSGLITSFNKGAENLLGYAASEMVGKQTLNSFLIADEIEARGAVLAKTLVRPSAGLDAFVEHTKGGGFDEHEYTFVRKDGRRLIANVVMTGIRDSAGLPSGLLGIGIDISERKKMEKELGASRDAAVQSERTKAEFLANMSHEIRTPLNAIVGMTGLLMDTSLDAEQKEFGQTVQHASENLLQIINDILDFSKIEAGKLSLEAVDFNVQDLIEESVQLIALRAHAKGLELLSSVSEDIRCGISGDPGRLRQVLVNLLANAVKFTETGEILLKASREADEGGRVTILFEIKDTGIGIPFDVQSRIFQAFTQADASTTRRYGGTGLGLAISRRLIDLMGGQIGVCSVPGEGSTFWVRVPFEERPQQGTNRPIGLAGRRVLIVDDNRTNRDILRRQLAVWGLSCDEASSGTDAVRIALRAAAEDRPFQLAIIDMRMPEMDGFELARRLKGESTLAGLPIIMMSSLDNRPERETLSDLGILSCLTKPVRQSVLLDAVVSSLAKHSEESTVSAPSQPLSATNAFLRVLIVEDNSVNQRVAVLQLKKLGYESDAVANGLEALEALDRIPYGLVLMDCQMPEMDGFEAARVIRKREKDLRHTPIVAMTANALDGDREKCVAAGMDDYISKPVKPQALAQILHRWGSAVDLRSLEDLRELVDHDATAFQDLVRQYLSNTENILTGLRTATSAWETAKVEDLAHTLKGSCSHFGAHLLMNLCQQMEASARADRATGARSLLIGLENECIRVREALESIIPAEVAS